MAETNLIGDPTNPNPKKPKSATLDEQMDFGITSKQGNTYGTNLDTYLPNGQLGSKYDGNFITPMQDQATQRDANQPWGDKAANGLIKAAGLAGSTAVGTFTSLPFGIGGAIFNIADKKSKGLDIDARDFEPIFNNPVQDVLNKFNEDLEASHTNYASEEERDAPALSFKNVFTPNFLFDKIIKNAGFTVGAIASGKVVGGMLTNASKIILGGVYSAESVAEVEALTAKGMQLPQALEKVATAMGRVDKVNQYLATGVMAAGEAQFEANDAFKSAGISLEASYRDHIAKTEGEDKRGRELLPSEKENIHKRQSSIGLTTMGVNMAILGLSDTIQFGSTLTQGFKSESRVLGKTVMREGIEVPKEVTKGARWGARAHAFGEGMITEGWEEGAQNFTQKAATDYYSRKNDLSAKASIDDLLHSTVYGLGQTVGTKEGIESMLLGAITGVASHVGMGAFNGQVKADWNKADDDYQYTQDKLDAMAVFGKHAKDAGLFAKYDGAKRVQSIQQSMEDAVKQGDAFVFQNLKHDRLKAMVQAHTEAGRMSQLMDKLDGLKDMSQTEFATAFGVDDLSKKSVSDYVETMKAEANKMTNAWDQINTRFASSSESDKVQLWDKLTNIENRLKREKEVGNTISGINKEQTPTGISWESILAENKGDKEKAEVQFREVAAKHLEEVGEGTFSDKDVDEFFKLQQDRKANIEGYQRMKKGEDFVKDKVPVVTPEKEKEQIAPEEGATPLNPLVEDAPKNKKAKVETKLKVNPPKEGTTTTGLSALAHEMVRVIRKAYNSGAADGGGRSLEGEDKKLFLRAKSGKTTEDQDASLEARNFLDKYEGKDDEIDAFFSEEEGDPDDDIDDDDFDEPTDLTNQSVVDKLGKGKALTKEEETYYQTNKKAIDRMIKSQTDAEKVVRFKKAIKELWDSKPGGLYALKAKYFSTNGEPKNSLLTDNRTKDDLLKEITELEPQINDLMDLATVVNNEDGSPNLNLKKSDRDEILKNLTVLAKTIEELEGLTEHVANKKKAEDPKDKVTPIDSSIALRIEHRSIYGKEVDSNLSSEQKWIKTFYSQLGSIVGVTMSEVKGLIIAPSMGVKVIYDPKAKHFNIYAGEGKGAKKIGYLSEVKPMTPNITMEELEKNFTPEDLALNRRIIEEAKKGPVSLIIDWNFGLNNQSGKRGLLSESVFGTLKLGSDIKIYRNVKPNSSSSVIDMHDSRGKLSSGLMEQDRMVEKGLHLNDNYYMVVKDPNGDDRSIGLTSAPVTTQGLKDFKAQINSSEQDIKELKSKFWLAANRIKGTVPFSTNFFLGSDGVIKIKVSPNLRVAGSTAADEFGITDSSKNLGFITIPKTFKDQADFISKLKFESDKDESFIKTALKNSKLTMADLFSDTPIRQEVKPGSIEMTDFVLSLNPSQPWLPSAIITGTESIAPLVKAKGKQTIITPDTSKTSKNTETKEGKTEVPNEDQNADAAKARTSLFDKQTGLFDFGIDFKVSNSDQEVVKANFDVIKKKLVKFLPKSIKLDKIETLLNGLYANDSLWGAFSQNVIYLANNIGKGTEYHEAFHAVFRVAFTPEEQATIRQLVTPVGGFSPEVLTGFRASRSEYNQLTNEQATIKILDEISADLFQEYMNNAESTNPVIQALKEFFNWLKNLLSFTRNNETELNDIFADIRNGKYINRSEQDITDDLSFKTLPGVTSGDSRTLIDTVIVNIFNRGIKVTDKESIIKIIDEISQDPMITPLTEIYSKELHSGMPGIRSGKLFLNDIFASPEIIRKEVMATLKAYGKAIDDEAGVEDLDDETKRYKDIAFDDNPFETTMFGSIPEKIRNMLLSIGIQKSTNTLMVPISVLGTYAQLKRLLVGQESYEDMKKQIKLYKGSSPEVQAVYDSMLTHEKDLNFRAVFRNTFTLEYADSMHIDINPDKNEFSVYASNRKDETAILIGRWKNAYERISSRENQETRKKLAKEALKELKSVAKLEGAGKEKIDFTDLQKSLYTVGIEVTGHLLERVISGEQMLSVDTPYPFSGTTESPLSFFDDLNTILTHMSSNGNLFSTEDGEGVMSRLQSLASADVLNRNDVYQTSFRNSNNKSVQSMMKPNFELVMARKLRQGLESLSEKEGNYIVDRFKEMMPEGEEFDDKIKLDMSIFGGARSRDKEEGVTAKMIDPKSKMLAMFIAYSEGFINPFVPESKTTEVLVNVGSVLGTKIKADNGKSAGVRYEDFTTKRPSGSEGYNKLNKLSLDSYKYMVARDMKRITETASEIEDNKFKHVEDFHFVVKGDKVNNGYLNDKPILTAIDKITELSQIPRGLKLTQFPKLQTAAEAIFTAQKEKNWTAALEEATTKLDKFLQAEHVEMIEELKKTMKDQGIDLKKDRSFIMGNRVSQFANMDDFLSDFVAGNFILVDSYADLIRGTEAKYLGPIDITKRAAGLVANGTSVGVKGKAKMIIGADIITKYDPGVTDIFGNPIKGTDKNNKTDAQSIDSTEYRIAVLEGLGKINSTEKAILFKRHQGFKLTPSEITKMSKIDGLNSLKLVGFDGNVYWKTSVYTLWPDLTNEYDPETKKYDGPAIKGMEGLEQLRKQMISAKKDIFAFESAIKLGRADKQFGKDVLGKNHQTWDFTEENGIELDNQFIRLQVENPTGKMKVTLATQLLQLIDSEVSEYELDTKGNQKLDPTGKPIEAKLMIGDNSYTIKQLKDLSENILSGLTDEAFNQANTLINTNITRKDGTLENLFISIMGDSAKMSGATDTEQQYYQQNGKGGTVLSQSLTNRINKNIEGFMSYFNKTVFSKTVSGMKLTLISPFGITKANGESLQIHRYIKENGKESIRHAECMISEEILQKYNLRVEFDANRNWTLYPTKSKIALDAIAVDKVLTMLGFRIPTQSHHSMMPFKVVGFLPASYGSSVVVPAEVAHLAGSDYDVDSLFVNRKEFYINKDNQLIIYGESSDPAVQYMEWKQNMYKDPIVKKLVSKVEDYGRIAQLIREKQTEKLQLVKEKVTINKTIKKLKEKESTTGNTKKLDKQAQLLAEVINKLTPIQQRISELEEDKEGVYALALSQLNLPATLEQWNKKPIQSIYSRTNKLLDIYMAFMTNPANKESIFTPASMDSIAKAGDLINTKLYNISENSNLPYNFFVNLFNHWKANKSDIVGPAANASKVSAFLSKHMVKLKKALTIGNHTSSGYNTVYENDINLIEKDGKVVIAGVLRRRKADSLSSLVSAMTDNAKERLAIMLNLSVNTIDNLGNMLALGFGMNRTMLFGNQPVIRQLSMKMQDEKAHIGKKGTTWEITEKTLVEIEKYIEEKDRVKILEKSFTDQQLLDASTPENLAFMSRLIRERNINYADVTKKQFEFIKVQYAVLSKYKELQDTTKYFSTANRLLNTNKGIGIAGEELDRLREDVNQFDGKNKDKAFDFPLANSIKTNMTAALFSSESVDNNLSNTFINRNLSAKRLFRDLDKTGRMNIKRSKTFQAGYIAELAMMGFNKAIKNSADPYMNGKTLADFEYLLSEKDNTVDWDKRNIVEQYRYINQEFNKPNSVLRRNIAFQNMIPSEPNDTNPFFRIEFNTNMKVDAKYYEELMSAMDELLRLGAPGTPIVRFANNLILSLGVKDSFEYRNNSPIKLIPPHRFLVMSKNLDKLQEILSSPRPDAEFEKWTGIKKSKFEKNFLHKWLRSPINQIGWKTIQPIEEDSPYLQNENTLFFDASKMSEETFKLVFNEASKPIKNDKNEVSWPLVLNSGISDYDVKTDSSYSKPVMWVREFVNTKKTPLLVTYKKVNIDLYNPHHSPYSIPLDFETDKVVFKKGQEPQMDQGDQGDDADEPQDDDNFDEPQEQGETPIFKPEVTDEDKEEVDDESDEEFSDNIPKETPSVYAQKMYDTGLPDSVVENYLKGQGLNTSEIKEVMKQCKVK